MGSKAPRIYWWNKEYTRRELMRESKWFLLFLALVHVVMGVIRMNDADGSDELLWDAAGLIAIGAIYAAAALLPLFWIRFACIALWLLNLLYSNTAAHAPRFQSIFFFILGAAFLYKMWKYRNAILEPTIESDITHRPIPPA